MPTRKEIVDGLMAWMGAYGIKEEDMVKAGVELFYVLDKLGVVKKVEVEVPEHKESPRNSFTGEKNNFGSGYDFGYYSAQQDMLKAGYVATESLI